MGCDSRERHFCQVQCGVWVLPANSLSTGHPEGRNLCLAMEWS